MKLTHIYAIGLYLLAKAFIIYGEYPEFDDFPDPTLIGVIIALTVLAAVYNAWLNNYEALVYLLILSALQLVAVKSGTYDSFLKFSIIGLVVILAGWFSGSLRGIPNRISTGILGVCLAVLIPESL